MLFPKRRPPETGRTTNDAARKFLLSQTVRAVLRSPYAAGPPDIQHMGIAGFMRGVLRDRSVAARTGYVAPIFGSKAADKLDVLTDGQLRPHRQAVVLSAALWESLAEAQELRLKTGGNDQSVGLRIVLFTFLTSRSPLIHRDTLEMLTVLEVERKPAAEAIARFCLRNHEPGENYGIWAKILNERGLGHLLPEWFWDPFTDEPVIDRGPRVPLVHPDDPWAKNLEDATGSGAEAIAFADMVVARQFTPPLAVGIFGAWGSGKSFFLRQIYEAIANNRKRYERDRSSGGDISFCQDVVQIRFNAWHYAETNLWPSLVDHILTCLDSWMSANGEPKEAQTLFGSLTTARHLTIEAAATLVAARQTRENKFKALQEAEAALQTKRKQISEEKSDNIKFAFNEIIKSACTNKDLISSATALGLPKIATDIDEFINVMRQLDDEAGRISLMRGVIFRELTNDRIVIFLAAGSIILPLALGWITSLIAPGAELGASIAGLITPISGALAWATSRGRSALETIRTCRDEFDRSLAEKLSDKEAVRATKADELSEAEDAVTQAADSLRKASEFAAQAEFTYRNETGARRILRFIRERISLGTYAKHLSFVANIRRDFEELTRLLNESWTPSAEADKARQAHASKVRELIASAGDLLQADEREMLTLSADTPRPDKERLFQRIVLYVDDLDRCRPAQVVAVLEAIQLLLTYPIFVVFVAVDVRWLHASLSDQFQRQLTNGEATTTDYLEKIFQIPYWVRPFGGNETLSLMRQHIGDLPPALTTPDEADKTAGASSEQPDEAADIAASASAGDAADGSDLSANPPSPQPDTYMTHALQLTDAEVSSLERVAPFLTPLPRRVVRFVNTYRILKGSLDPTAQMKLEQGGHRGLIALLAIAFLAEENFPEVARRLCTVEEADPGADVLETMSSLPEDTRARIRECLKALENPAPVDLAPHSDRIARFTFHPAGG